MGQSCFFRVLLVSSLILLIFFSNAMGRNLRTAKLSGVHSTAELFPSKDDNVRNMIELMDYKPPESNTNWSGFVAAPPPQSPPPP
ncbi:unnamed protein product [Eruca vesicaria subsp. sativa]|uniref:Transmembrane protein n=1 Tax=Eruca vesicaria subsp. sativa TaxID=29727 RepID=A0ABC8JNB6_ERUVS|nr:unnamed protein product [Eruca vesicaria subsp. sativa]